MSNWKTTYKLNKLHIFEFNKENNYSVTLPQEIRDKFNKDNLILVMNNLSSYTKITGYNLNSIVEGDKLKLDTTFNGIEMYYHERDIPDRDGQLEVSIVYDHYFDIPEKCNFVQFYLSACAWLSDDITEIGTDVYINNELYKTFSSKYITNPDEVNAHSWYRNYRLIGYVDLTETKYLGQKNEIKLKHFSKIGTAIGRAIYMGTINGNFFEILLYSPYQDKKVQNLEYTVNGYYLEEVY